MEVNFNINYNVRVKLTEHGINHWIAYNNEILKGIPHLHINEEVVMKKMLDNGYWEFPLWQLMNIFGDRLFAGNPHIPFTTDIVIPVELSRQNKIEKFLDDIKNTEEWVTIDEDDINTFPDEGYTVLVSDGTNYDVAYYLMSGEYKFVKEDLEKDDIFDFTAFKVTKWKFIK